MLFPIGDFESVRDCLHEMLCNPANIALSLRILIKVLLPKLLNKT